MDDLAQLEELSRMVHSSRRSVFQELAEDEEDRLPFMPSSSSEDEGGAGGAAAPPGAANDGTPPPRRGAVDARGHESYCGLRFARGCDCGPRGGPRQSATVSITNSERGFGMIISADGRVTRFNGAASAAEAAGVRLNSCILEVSGTRTSNKDAIVAALKAIPLGQPAAFKLLLPQQAEADDVCKEVMRPRQPSAAPALPSSSDEDDDESVISAPQQPGAEAAPLAELGLPPAASAPKPQLHPFKELFRAMPQEPRYRHRLELDRALMDKRFVRARWQLAAHWLEPGAGPRSMHVEWRVTPVKKKQCWTVTVFLEPPGGGVGEVLSTHPGCGSDSLLGYVSTRAAGETVRVEVSAEEGCASGAQVEVCVKALPQARTPTPPAAAPPKPEPEPEPESEPEPEPEPEPELDFPPEAFDLLVRQRDEMLAASGGELPTEWTAVVSSPPLPVPFNLSANVAEMRVVRRFSSKAMPYWLQFKDDKSGAVTDVVMKMGDDLRQVIRQQRKKKPCLDAHTRKARDFPDMLGTKTRESCLKRTSVFVSLFSTGSSCPRYAPAVQFHLDARGRHAHTPRWWTGGRSRATLPMHDVLDLIGVCRDAAAIHACGGHPCC
jgi:hypothetical protein